MTALRTSWLIALTAGLLFTGGALAQDPAANVQEPSVAPETVDPRASGEGGEVPAADTPNWPEGVEDWESGERNVTGDPNEAERRGLTSPEVEESLPPNPTEQGTRPPEADTAAPEESPSLYPALAAVRRAPPTLDGARRMPRPNRLGSEPETEMAPDPEGAPGNLFRDGYIE